MSAKNNVQDMDDQILNRMLQDFLEEARERLDYLNLNLVQLEEEPAEEALIDEIFRTVHTLKGSAAFAGLKEISEIARKMEEVFGNVRKGTIKITSPFINIMYEGVDILTIFIEKAADNDGSEVDTSRILEKLDQISRNTLPGFEEESEKYNPEFLDSQELLDIYKKSYNQLVALKHLVYSSVHLSDPESLAVLFSKQIDERMSPERNAFWLVEDGQKVVEIARDGMLVDQVNRRVLEIESSEIIKRVIREQLAVWPSSLAQVNEMFPEFESPFLFPIKAQPEAFGFLVLDPEESADVELYQFVGQFAAMILKISTLHQKVEEQKIELDEMTEILFKQNAQLSSLYHVELDLMKVNDPVHLCRIVAEAVVSDLEARRAAVFLIDESSRELMGMSESGGLQEIESMRLPFDKEKPIKQSLESGRIVSYRDYPEKFQLGPNLMEDWIVLCFKGRDRVQGVLVAEVEDEDIGDSISILANHFGILLDNLMLQKKFGNSVTET
jgi:chemotaxis protein histidine kinase CheA